MEHIIGRCKNCNKLYTYCTYGNGPEYGTEAGCTRDYCGECGTAVYNALKNIKRKVRICFKEIPYDNRLFDKLNDIKREVEADSFPPMCKIEPCYLANNEKEEYHYRNYIYRIGYDEDNFVHIYKAYEYDLINDCETDNPYIEPQRDGFMYLSGMVNVLNKAFEEKNKKKDD